MFRLCTYRNVSCVFRCEDKRLAEGKIVLEVVFKFLDSLWLPESLYYRRQNPLWCSSLCTFIVSVTFLVLVGVVSFVLLCCWFCCCWFFFFGGGGGRQRKGGREGRVYM